MFTISGYISTKAPRVALVVAVGATLAVLAAIALLASSPAARAAGENCQPSGSDVTCTFPAGTSTTWTVPDSVDQRFTFDVIGAVVAPKKLDR
jgi:hypothetical protein